MNEATSFPSGTDSRNSRIPSSVRLSGIHSQANNDVLTGIFILGSSGRVKTQNRHPQRYNSPYLYTATYRRVKNNPG